MKYKVGDKVRIKSLDWYYENKDIHGNIECGDALMNIEKSQFCSKIVTISSISNIIDTYQIEEDNGKYIWTDDMIEGLVEKKISIKLTGEAIKNNERVVSVDEYILPEGYIFKDENGNVINTRKIVLEKKKEYPKTYEECCKVLGVNPFNYLTIKNVLCYNGEEEIIKYERDLLNKFGFLWKLHICRNAYWKIAGEKNKGSIDYVICNVGGNIISTNIPNSAYNHILIFPTEEMRNAFYENFKEEIEQCKELL